MPSIARRRSIRFLVYATVVGISSLIAAAVQSSTLGVWIEQKTYDFRFGLRGSLPRSQEVPVVILAIDEESLSQVPDPLVLWQKHLARVLDQLVEAQAAAVGLDFILADIGAIDPHGQRAFLESLLRAKDTEIPVVLAYRVRRHFVEQPPILLTMAAGQEAFAYINLTTDSDDFVRRQKLYSYDQNSRLIAGFAYAVTRSFTSLTGKTLDLESPREEAVLINYRGPGHFNQVSFARVLEAADNRDLDFLRRNFRDRIVLIGQIGDGDLHATPFYHWIDYESSQTRRTPGIEIHANVIATLLDGSCIRRLQPGSQLVITFLVIAAVGLLCFLFSPVVAVVGSFVLMGAYAFVVLSWAFQQGWWVLLVPATSGGICAIGLSEICNFMLEGRDKRQLRKLFKSYVNDQVIERILETPENLALQGERRKIAVLFSDIEGFTSRSERVPAEKVVAYLNWYFTAMVDAIQANHGMVDKFIGDGIMAVFGAPLDDEDASYHAVRAGQAMLNALGDLNERLTKESVEPIRIGIGIHSGEAVVGNIGSPQKMEYTAIGDVVNTASRVEGLTRSLDAQLLVSGETARVLGGRVDTEYLGDHEVKGREEPVPIYRVVNQPD